MIGRSQLEDYDGQVKKNCKKIKVTNRISGSETLKNTETAAKSLSLEGAVGMFLTHAKK